MTIIEKILANLLISLGKTDDSSINSRYPLCTRFWRANVVKNLIETDSHCRSVKDRVYLRLQPRRSDQMIGQPAPVQAIFPVKTYQSL
jgi:hypothetical protein